MAAKKAGQEDSGPSIAAAARGDLGAGSGKGTRKSNLRGTSGDDVLEGTDGADRIRGKAGDDVLDGLGGDDHLDGGRGDDEIYGGDGADRIHGGRGDDRIDGGDGADRIHGGRGEDAIDGGDGADRIHGGRGDDEIDGGAGADRIHGGKGDDTIDGGDGADRIHGGRGEDAIDGGDGADRIHGGRGDDEIDRGAGADRIHGGKGADTIDGGTGADRIHGGKGADTIDGGTGADRIHGGKGDDAIDGGDGADRIYGGKGEDTIDGGDGADWIKGGTGNDVIDGGDGADFIAGGAGADVISGGAGADIIFGDGGRGRGSGGRHGSGSGSGSGGDFGFGDYLDGGAGSDMVFGGWGADTATSNMEENFGAWDVYDGGGGADYLVLELTANEWADAGVQADLAAFADFLATSADGARRGGSTFSFSAFHLDASNWETFEVVLTTEAQVAVDDVAATDEDAAVDIDVLANDGPASGLTVSSFDASSALGAQVGLNADGTLRYDPTGALDGLAAGEVATDSFAYTVTDPTGATATATVTVTVEGVNDAPVIEAATAGLAVVAEGSIATVAGLYSDADLGDTHQVTIDWGDGTAAETAALTAGGFDIAGGHVYGDDGAYTVTLTVTDDNGASATDALTITVENLDPTADDDSVVTDEDTAVTLDVLSNDTDVAADLPLAITAVTQGAHGAVGDGAGGAVTYTPDADYNGTDSFSYTVSDGDGGFDVATVSVTVNAVNDAPVMADSANFAIDENLPPATLVGTAPATDIDAGGALTFSITAGNASSAFAIDAATGAIATTAPLDFEAVPGYTLTVQAMDAGGLPDTTTVTVAVNDVNEAPAAADNAYATDEDTPLSGNLILDDTGAGVDGDPDAGDVLSIDGAAAGAPLIVTTAQGATVTIEADGAFTYDPTGAGPLQDLDFGALATDSFTYRVRDGDGASDTATVTVTVDGVSDNSPPVALDQSVSMAEDTLGTFGFDATDPDLAQGDDLTFTVLTGPASGLLTLDNLGDTFTYVPDADFNGADSFTYQVSDGTGEMATATVTLTVDAVNDAPSNVSLDNASIDENAAGAVVGTLSASDPDAGDTHTFTVDDLRFEVVGNQLELKAGESLDHEGEATVNVTVTATDAGGLATSQLFTVAVNDLNEAPTGIALDNASIDENAAGAIVGTLSASDPDAGDSHTYTVDDLRFEVVGNQLELKAGESLDHEAGDTVAVTVTATDAGGLATSQLFAVAVNDVNEAPTAVSLDNASIDENAAGAVVGALSASDPDAGDSHTYTVDDLRFEVVGNQLELKAGESLDHEAGDTVAVTVTATDAGGLATSQLFTVAVNDVNEAPTAVSLDNASIDENAAGAVVGALSASDPDAGDSHTYTVDDLRFEVVGNQLELKAGESLDHEAGTTVAVTVTAADAGGLATSQLFTVAVNDVNEAPTAVSLDSASIDENAAGAVVGTLAASDPDLGDTHTFTVDDLRFEVVGDQLKLKAGESLDREVEASVDVTVTATDAGGLSTSQVLTIAVNDVDEAPTGIALDNAVVDENAAGAVAGTLSASDPDLGDTHTFTVDDLRFEVVGNQLELKAGESLDHEAGTTVAVTVTAADAGGLATSQLFTVAVNDVNEAPTAVSLDSASIDENAAGAVVGTLAASDPDLGDTHTFTVDDLRFEVVGDQLKLKAGESLDREVEASVDVTVTATDAGGLSTSQVLTIAVNDVDEAPTGIALDNAVVDENAAGAVAGTLSASDPDLGDTHTFTVDDLRFEVVGDQLKLKAGRKPRPRSWGRRGRHRDGDGRGRPRHQPNLHHRGQRPERSPHSGFSG